MRQTVLQAVGYVLKATGRHDRLMVNLRSKQHDEARLTMQRFRALGWLHDGTLRGAVLAGASLQGLDLQNAVFAQGDFYRANLRGTNLSRANLSDANLTCANLQDADLTQANLRNAFLWGADLRGADLSGADLSGAFIGKDDLPRALAAHNHPANASISTPAPLRLDAVEWDKSFPDGTLFDEDTILPDGTRWTVNSDLGRFTQSTPFQVDAEEATAVL